MRWLAFVFTYLFPVLLAAQEKQNHFTFLHGAVIRGDSTKKELTLVFTADEFGEGIPTIIRVLKKHKIKASFFFTGRFYRNDSFQLSIRKLKKQDHYLGPHSDEHLLYCDWTKRDSLLVTKDSFSLDIDGNMQTMKAIGIAIHQPHYFIPPYEWWNDSISKWSEKKGLRLVSFTSGIRTNADYTYPELGSAYKSSNWIINSLKALVSSSPKTLNGAIILTHSGTDPRRKDKLYNRLDEIIIYLKKNGYQFKRIDELIAN